MSEPLRNGERVMVCMSSNRLAPRVIHAGARVAAGPPSKWYAVYVETPRERPGRLDSRDAEALRRNIRLAESLGAIVVRVMADCPSDGLVAFARREGVTRVILGETARSRWERLWRESTLHRLLHAIPGAAVQIVPLSE